MCEFLSYEAQIDVGNMPFILSTMQNHQPYSPTNRETPRIEYVLNFSTQSESRPSMCTQLLLATRSSAGTRSICMLTADDSKRGLNHGCGIELITQRCNSKGG